MASVRNHVPRRQSTAVSSEAWAKLRERAVLACKGRLLLSGSVVLASLKAAVWHAASAKRRTRASDPNPAENATGATEDQISRSEGEEEAEEGEDATSKIHLG